jgi:hypothetical protein
MKIDRTARSITVPCAECGGAMALERVQPEPEHADVNLHEFRCEICNTTEFIRFKKELLKTRWSTVQPI